MSKTDTIVRMRRDGTLCRVMPDGPEIPMVDPGPLAPMTEEQVSAAARRDPDARPMPDKEFWRARRIPRIKTLRRAPALTQEEFAARFRLARCAIGNRAARSPTSRRVAYLTVIARDPDGVRRAIEARPRRPIQVAELPSSHRFQIISCRGGAALHAHRHGREVHRIRRPHEKQVTSPLYIDLSRRPLRGPLRDASLAICDATTVAFTDFVPSDLVYRNRTGETYRVTYNPAHRWFYVPEMRADEAILIKCYDSGLDKARFTAHSAFEDPTAPADVLPRESIELRTLTFPARPDRRGQPSRSFASPPACPAARLDRTAGDPDRRRRGLFMHSPNPPGSFVEHDGSLADPNAFRKADARRLVAHIRTVWKIVRAEAPGDQLVHERRLVRGAS
jgi:DNA-binding transcriptional regulator YiaG